MSVSLPETIEKVFIEADSGFFEKTFQLVRANLCYCGAFSNNPLQ